MTVPRRDRKPAAVSDPNPRVSLELRSLLPYPNSCPGTSPHQQERDTKMAMLSFAGIDVSKDRLDVVVLPEEECSSVPNAAGWAELIEQLTASRSRRSASRRVAATSAVSCMSPFPATTGARCDPRWCARRGQRRAHSLGPPLSSSSISAVVPPAPEGEPQRPRTAWRPLLLPRAESSWAHSLY